MFIERPNHATPSSIGAPWLMFHRSQDGYVHGLGRLVISKSIQNAAQQSFTNRCSISQVA